MYVNDNNTHTKHEHLLNFVSLVGKIQFMDMQNIFGFSNLRISANFLLVFEPNIQTVHIDEVSASVFSLLIVEMRYLTSHY